MNDERKRILRMLAEGTISMDECEELLESLKERAAQPEGAPELEQRERGPRPKWPYVLLAVVLVVGLLSGGLVLLRGPRSRLLWPISWPLPRFGGISFGTLVFIGWAWMLVDCLSRPFRDFRLLFTRNPEYEKWIWIAIVLLASWVGALAYFVIIREPAEAIHVRTPVRRPVEQPPYVPGPRARALKGWVFLLMVILVLVWLVPSLLSYFPARAMSGWLHGPFRTRFAHDPTRYIYGWPWKSAVASIALVGIASVGFWLWMLIDCIGRDYREFGRLITSDQTADKLLWLILIVCSFLIGAIAYHVAVRRRLPPARPVQA